MKSKGLKGLIVFLSLMIFIATTWTAIFFTSPVFAGITQVNNGAVNTPLEIPYESVARTVTVTGASNFADINGVAVGFQTSMPYVISGTMLKIDFYGGIGFSGDTYRICAQNATDPLIKSSVRVGIGTPIQDSTSFFFQLDDYANAASTLFVTTEPCSGEASHSAIKVNVPAGTPGGMKKITCGIVTAGFIEIDPFSTANMIHIPGGQENDWELSVSPSVGVFVASSDAGMTTFNVSNTGTGTMPWTAQVTSGGSWLTITSGSSGTNSGTINCSFTANTGASNRTATITVTATGAFGSPKNVMVTQEGIIPTTGITQVNNGAVNTPLEIPYKSVARTVTMTGASDIADINGVAVGFQGTQNISTGNLFRINFGGGIGFSGDTYRICAQNATDPLIKSSVEVAQGTPSQNSTSYHFQFYNGTNVNSGILFVTTEPCSGDASHSAIKVNVPASTPAGVKTIAGRLMTAGGLIFEAFSSADMIRILGSCNLQISQSPNAGAVGTEFSLTGNRFTPNSTATIYFSNPYVFPNMCVSIDRNGKFSNSPRFTVPANTPNGFYTWWAVDGITGCESEHLPFTIDTTTISTGNYNVTNTQKISNQFELWLDVSINNQKPGENFKNQYTIDITPTSGLTVSSIGTCEYKGDGTIKNSSRYRQYFQINSAGAQAWFENGSVNIRKNGQFVQTISDMNNFSVYGTNFKISRDAWSFDNKSWNYVIKGTDTHKAADVIDMHIFPYQKDVFWASVGINSSSASHGMCHGLTNAAIANFNNKDGPWGTGKSDQWENDIDTHWSGIGYAQEPFQSLENIYTYNLNWEFSSAKKIMYYHTTSSFYRPENIPNTWVGRDTYYTLSSSEIPKSILKNGSPLSFSFTFDPKGSHTIAVTQLITYNSRDKYILWDNEYPFGTLSADYGPYLIWDVRPIDKCNNLISFSNWYVRSIWSVRSQDEAQLPDQIKYTMKELPAYLAGDTQNIYNQRSSQQSINYNTEKQEATNTTSTQSYPGMIEVSIIGGEVTIVTTNGSAITLVPNDDPSTGQAVIYSSSGNSFNKLYLPVGKTYRIDAKKLSSVPFLKVFVRTPQTDGTVESLNYDAVQTGETDATQVYFYVGVGNTEKAIRRTAAPATARMQVQAAAGDYPPDFDQTLTTQINPPGNFRAFVENGVVQLGWVNTIHPNLSAVKIVRTTGTYPTSPDDGVTVYDALGTSAQDNTVSIGTLYFYAAYSRDTSSAYSEPVYASVNTYLYSIYGKVALSTGEGVSGASAVLVDGSGQTVGVATSGSDGNYLFSNLEMDAYTLTVSHPSHTIDNPQRSISIEGQNIEENFTAVPVPTLQLLFNPSFVNIGSTVSVPWAYRTIANTETVKIELYRGGVWQTLAASVPILTGNIQWTVTGPADAQAKIRISLNANPSLTNENTFSIVDPNDIGLTGPGWNLISLPLQPSNTAITNVLGSISGKYTSTWAYQNDSWKVFDPASPGLSDLSILETGWGYWLDMTEAATLSVTGTEPSKTINLITGWNLVGYNSSTSQNIADALASIAGKVVSVWAYKNDSWEFYDPANPGLSDLTTMSPGYGYWINTNGVCTWTLP